MWEQIFHISGKNRPNFIKGALQTQGKKDLTNRQTQWFRRKLRAKENHPLEWPKAEPCCAAKEPTVLPGDQVLACTNLRGPEKAMGCTEPCNGWGYCAFLIELPLCTGRQRRYHTWYLQICTKKHLGIARELAPAESAAFKH